MKMTSVRLSTRGVVGCASVVALAACLLAPGAALAKKKAPPPIKLHSGRLTIAFTSKVYAALTKDSTTGVFSTQNSVSPVAPATSSKKASYSFPIGSTKLNGKTFGGKVGSKGGLRFESAQSNPISSGTIEFSLMTFALHFGSTSDLTATFVGANTNPGQAVATFATKHMKHSKHGHSLKLSNITLKLTPDGASIMQGMGGTWKNGQTLGTASVSAST